MLRNINHCGILCIMLTVHFRQHPVLHQLLYEFIQSVGILHFDARTPGHHSEEDGARNNRLEF